MVILLVIALILSNTIIYNTGLETNCNAMALLNVKRLHNHLSMIDLATHDNYGDV